MKRQPGRTAAVQEAAPLAQKRGDDAVGTKTTTATKRRPRKRAHSVG
jgi:hypothetical protein